MTLFYPGLVLPPVVMFPHLILIPVSVSKGRVYMTHMEWHCLGHRVRVQGQGHVKLWLVWVLDPQSFLDTDGSRNSSGKIKTKSPMYSTKIVTMSFVSGIHWTMSFSLIVFEWQYKVSFPMSPTTKVTLFATLKVALCLTLIYHYNVWRFLLYSFPKAAIFGSTPYTSYFYV